MKQFRFRLQAPLALRENERDLHRQLLAEALRLETELQQRRGELQHEHSLQIEALRQIERPGTLDVDAAAARRDYAGTLRHQLADVEMQHVLVSRQVDACRQALLAADARVKTLENLREKQAADHRTHAERTAANEIEETWRSIEAGAGRSKCESRA